MSQHLMLIPTLDCPAECHYCFGPHRDSGSTMSRQTLEAVARWQRKSGNGSPLEIIFHGGEPLVPGATFYREALPFLQEVLAPRRVRFAVQSNLWLLNNELCELFREYEVALGTSLDGPEAINDAQRGAGYFKKTMAGIELARSQGLSSGCICTFTAQSVKNADTVFNFFMGEGLNFSIHAALKPFGQEAKDYALSPADHGRLLTLMLNHYLDHTSKIEISTIDAMARSISAGKGGICTFTDCLGHYLAVDPEGWIYPCQRLAGFEQFKLGSVFDCPTEEDLAETSAWRALKDRQERIDETCSDCSHLEYCRGGCPYIFLAANKSLFNGDLRDPHCPAYQQTFNEITDRALAEVFSDENMAAVASGHSEKYGLLRKGKLLHIMRGSTHPREATRQARQIVAATALGVCDTPESALQKLDQAGVITNPNQALESLKSLQKRLDTQSRRDLLNAYIHVTTACNLSCKHCYAAAQSLQGSESMPIDELARLVKQAAKAGFTKTVITGGEPLIHPQRNALLESLAALRSEVKPMKIVLRTNLTCSLTPMLARQLLSAADELVVSVDGDKVTHDARRGGGTYDQAINNLHILLDHSLHDDGSGEPGRFAANISLAATLEAEQIDGPAGKAVQKLGEKLDLGVRFKAVLPLGRGAQLDLKPSFYSSLDDDSGTLSHTAHPAATCGLGMNLYISPNGDWDVRHYLGNAITESLDSILDRNNNYHRVTVDSNYKCHNCILRYLCGGFCRAWSKSENPNEALLDCSSLYKRAERMLDTALEVLEIDRKKWKATDLPWPKN